MLEYLLSYFQPYLKPKYPVIHNYHLFNLRLLLTFLNTTFGIFAMPLKTILLSNFLEIF